MPSGLDALFSDRLDGKKSCVCISRTYNLHFMMYLALRQDCIHRVCARSRSVCGFHLSRSSLAKIYLQDIRLAAGWLSMIQHPTRRHTKRTTERHGRHEELQECCVLLPGRELWYHSFFDCTTRSRHGMPPLALSHPEAIKDVIPYSAIEVRGEEVD